MPATFNIGLAGGSGQFQLGKRKLLGSGSRSRRDYIGELYVFKLQMLLTAGQAYLQVVPMAGVLATAVAAGKLPGQRQPNAGARYA